MSAALRLSLCFSSNSIPHRQQLVYVIDLTADLLVCTPTASLGRCIMTSNNDNVVRLFDANTIKARTRLQFPWAVNYSTMRPPGATGGGGATAAVVGDDPVTWVMDVHSGIKVMELKAHKDYSFAVAWHPDGWLLATGNQDTTTIVWDLRYPSEPLVSLPGRMGAIRSIRFSPDGRFLAAAEPADFIHVYDVQKGFSEVQEFDLFGEVAGFAFSPDSESLFVGISDVTYSSLLQYQRHKGEVPGLFGEVRPLSRRAGHKKPSPWS
eukprot:jgi/Chrzof1/9800/Cz04g16040.t1